MKQEKKFFSVKLKTCNNNLSKRWYLECWHYTHNGTNKKRTFVYGNINKGVTIEERLLLAEQLIKEIHITKTAVTVKQSILNDTLNRASLDLRFKSISAYRTVITCFLKYLSDTPDNTVSSQRITDFLLHIKNNGLSNNTISKYRNTLFTLYNKAIYYEFINYNPVQKIKPIKRDSKSLMYFSDKQIELLKIAISKENKQLWLCVQLLYYCFIRPGEQRFLKVRDVNLDYGFIEVPAEISKNKKTQKVAIPTIFLKELEFIKKYPPNYYLLSSTGTCGTGPISMKWIYTHHKRYLSKLQIVGRYSFYSWKHTGVVKCVQFGLNIRDIQNQLRHHSLDMVQIYLKNLGVLQSVELKEKYPTL